MIKVIMGVQHRHRQVRQGIHDSPDVLYACACILQKRLFISEDQEGNHKLLVQRLLNCVYISRQPAYSKPLIIGFSPIMPFPFVLNQVIQDNTPWDQVFILI